MDTCRDAEKSIPKHCEGYVQRVWWNRSLDRFDTDEPLKQLEDLVPGAT